MRQKVTALTTTVLLYTPMVTSMLTIRFASKFTRRLGSSPVNQLAVFGGGGCIRRGARQQRAGTGNSAFEPADNWNMRMGNEQVREESEDTQVRGLHSREGAADSLETALTHIYSHRSIAQQLQINCSNHTRRGHTTQGTGAGSKIEP